MDRIRKAIPDRAAERDLQHVVERDLLPVVKQVRDAVNANAPCGRVIITNYDTFRDVVFEEQERDADYLVFLMVQGTFGSPPARASIVSCSRIDEKGFRIECQYRPGMGNSVTVGWHIKR